MITPLDAIRRTLQASAAPVFLVFCVAFVIGSDAENHYLGKAGEDVWLLAALICAWGVVASIDLWDPIGRLRPRHIKGGKQ